MNLFDEILPIARCTSDSNITLFNYVRLKHEKNERFKWGRSLCGSSLIKELKRFLLDRRATRRSPKILHENDVVFKSFENTVFLGDSPLENHFCGHEKSSSFQVGSITNPATLEDRSELA